MQSIPLVQALGGMAQIPQFFIWHLRWDAAERKYLKRPIASMGEPWPMDASKPENWLTFEAASMKLDVMRALDLTAEAEGRAYSLGFYMTPGCGYWFLDFDHCLVDGQYQGVINEWAPQFSGCFYELSSSGDGAHIIGRGTVPTHAKKNKATGTELYTEMRGICFGLSGVAYGCADVGSPAIASIASLYFPPKDAGEEGEFLTPRSDWHGPADDEALLALMLASKSLAARFGNKASFEQLWNGREEELAPFYGDGPGNERDMALASHLAFWTGCDAPRMERLMRRSGLVRAKWDEHRTYLRELTIANACAGCKDVYNDRKKADALYELKPLGALPALAPLAPIAPLPVVTQVVSTEAVAVVEGLLDLISASTDWADVHNRVIPAIRDAGVPAALMPRLENAVNKRLDLWDAKLSVAKLRVLLNPPRAQSTDDDDDVSDVTRPHWVGKYVYVRQGDMFHDMESGLSMSTTSFKATHDRDMPVKGDGPMREDSAQWMLQRWNTPIVHDTMYHPGKPAGIIEYDGLRWANLYTASSHPVAALAFTELGTGAINRFLGHLWQLCGQRERVYQNLLAYMAHNVQFPGKKIRWVPIIKGTEGDGKTMLGRVLDAAMGGRNVASFGPEIIANGGGFTDWAHGNAFVALEEMYMAGKERHKIANALKQFISNEKVSVHPKGGKPKKVPNTCNQAAFTNHTDAVPIDYKKDRRWFVIFTPFDTRDQLWRAMGWATELESRKHFDAIFDSLAREPGEWRKWLLDLAIPEWFTADGAAMDTEEKEQMALSGVDDVESIARFVIEEGSHGVGKDALSSSMLTTAMRQRSMAEGVDIPKGHSLHHLLNRIGFVKVAKSIWWENAAHRVWVRPGVDHETEKVKTLLDRTKHR